MNLGRVHVMSTLSQRHSEHSEHTHISHSYAERRGLWGSLDHPTSNILLHNYLARYWLRVLDLIADKRKYSCRGASEGNASWVYGVSEVTVVGCKLTGSGDTLISAVFIASCIRKVSVCHLLSIICSILSRLVPCNWSSRIQKG